MRKMFGFVQDTRGRPVENASVRITAYPGGALATLYSDEGVTPKANPVMSNERGYWEAYLAAGDYTLTISSATETVIINDVTHDA